jgi:hypothetical protein
LKELKKGVRKGTDIVADAESPRQEKKQKFRVRRKYWSGRTEGATKQDRKSPGIIY